MVSPMRNAVLIVCALIIAGAAIYFVVQDQRDREAASFTAAIAKCARLSRDLRAYAEGRATPDMESQIVIEAKLRAGCT